MNDHIRKRIIKEKSKKGKIEFLPRVPQSLQEALYQTIHCSRIPAEEISRRLGISYQALVNGCNKNLGFRFSAKHIPALLRISSNPEILNFLARGEGYCLYRLPRVKSSGNLLSLSFEVSDNFQQFYSAFRNVLIEKHQGFLIDEAVKKCDLLIGSLLAFRVAINKNERRGEK